MPIIHMKVQASNRTWMTTHAIIDLGSNTTFYSQPLLINGLVICDYKETNSVKLPLVYTIKKISATAEEISKMMTYLNLSICIILTL